VEQRHSKVPIPYERGINQHLHIVRAHRKDNIMMCTIFARCGQIDASTSWKVFKIWKDLHENYCRQFEAMKPGR